MYTDRNVLDLINSHRDIPALPFCHLKFKTSYLAPGYPKEIRTIGVHIRKKRLDLGLLQKDVSKIIGVSKTTIYNWENARTTKPPVSIYPKVYEFLGYCIYDPGMPLKEKLVCWRKGLGLSQRKFAKRVGF